MENTTLTQAQKQFRLGKFSGSEIHKIMGAKGFGKTGETYIFEKAAEYLTGEPIKPEFTAASTSWGIDHEKEAKLYFEAATGLKVLDGDTIENDHIVGTPDGFVDGKAIGFEIKCPFNSGNHLKNLSMKSQDDLLDLRPEYYWQCVAYMWLANFPEWKFCSYDPRFKEEKRMLILNLKQRDEHRDLLMMRVLQAKEMFNQIISKL
jgi:hypothetical protein